MRDNSYPQSQYCCTAPYSLRPKLRRQCTPTTRNGHRAYDAATILHILAGLRVMHLSTSAALPTTIPPRTRARTHTTRLAPHTTTAQQRHGTCHPKQRTPTSHAPHIRVAHSHAAYKHTSPARPPQRPTRPRQLRTAQTSLHAHRHTHGTHSTAHSSAHPTHRPQKITPSHTTLTSELSGCPASTGCCRRVGF